MTEGAFIAVKTLLELWCLIKRHVRMHICDSQSMNLAGFKQSLDLCSPGWLRPVEYRSLSLVFHTDRSSSVWFSHCSDSFTPSLPSPILAFSCWSIGPCLNAFSFCSLIGWSDTSMNEPVGVEFPLETQVRTETCEYADSMLPSTVCTTTQMLQQKTCDFTKAIKNVSHCKILQTFISINSLTCRERHH